MDLSMRASEGEAFENFRDWRCRILALQATRSYMMGKPDPIPGLSECRRLYHLAGEGFTSRLEWMIIVLHNDSNRAHQIVQRVFPA